MYNIYGTIYSTYNDENNIARMTEHFIFFNYRIAWLPLFIEKNNFMYLVLS